MKNCFVLHFAQTIPHKKVQWFSDSVLQTSTLGSCFVSFKASGSVVSSSSACVRHWLAKFCKSHARMQVYRNTKEGGTCVFFLQSLSI